MSNILFELGTEELPPTTLNNLAKSLYAGVVSELEAARINFDKTNSRWFASPRRLAFILNDIDNTQADKKIQKRGPAVTAAFDELGTPRPAAIGFAKSVNAEVADLATLKTNKGEWLVYDFVEKGKKTTDLIAGFIQLSIKKLPIPKPMRWGNNDFAFIRPVHWIVLMQDNQVIPFELFDLVAGNQSRGHRFHAPDYITINSTDTYVQQLLKVFVEVDQDSRKENIRQQVVNIAKSLNATAKIDANLLEEVTAMVEYPVAIAGGFDDDFLQVPAEALISSMQKHQKYFPVFAANNTLMPNFIALANIKSKDVSQVIKGFEKVIRPRLADARFFWEQDQKQPLDTRLSMLEKMTFEKQLGSIADKCYRVKQIMSYLAQVLELDLLQAHRAATLLKCDLVTDMVSEFPDLQGIMGGYYAKAQGEDDNVVTAISQQYKPTYSGDTIPDSTFAQALSIADKIDTLCGIFAVGKKPSGNKDPFALRRAALGIIKILQQGKLTVNIYELITVSLKQIDIANLDRTTLQLEIENFINQRLKHNYLEQDISHDVVEAVLALRPENLDDCNARIVACQNFKQDSSAPALRAANKRISNILRKSSEIIPNKIILGLLKQEQEKNLLGAIESIKRRFHQEVAQQQYQDAFKHLASLAEPVDNFFENVMVNSDDEATRLNRLAILKQLNGLFMSIADISKLEL
ncbi:Glycyl-tRNA synthetase beta chain [hydrothermal vent metagenome]|uniref:glycine--tRNA ligase n=1 Tax=hydrothermal vent metagenome TaxID=652676 RepID=A0A3B0V596_9ZZZZ